MKKGVIANLILILLVIFFFGYWWILNHVWFEFSEQSIIVDGKPLLNDYIPVKSLDGDLFLRNQDHQKQYLISLKKREISIISENYNFIDLVAILFISQSLVQTDSPDIKSKFDTDLVIARDYVEFTDIYGRQWHVPR